MDKSSSLVVTSALTVHFSSNPHDLRTVFLVFSFVLTSFECAKWVLSWSFGINWGQIIFDDIFFCIFIYNFWFFSVSRSDLHSYCVWRFWNNSGLFDLIDLLYGNTFAIGGNINDWLNKSLFLCFVFNLYFNGNLLGIILVFFGWVFEWIELLIGLFWLLFNFFLIWLQDFFVNGLGDLFLFVWWCNFVIYRRWSWSRCWSWSRRWSSLRLKCIGKLLITLVVSTSNGLQVKRLSNFSMENNLFLSFII